MENKWWAFLRDCSIRTGWAMVRRDVEQVLKNAVFPTHLAWEIGEAEDSHLELFCISLATWLAS